MLSKSVYFMQQFTLQVYSTRNQNWVSCGEISEDF